MLRVLRVRASSVAAAVLLALLAATASQALSAHGLGERDADYVPVSAVPHDESAHRLGAKDADDFTHPLHCLVCDWFRTFRPLRSILAHQTPCLEPRAAIHFDPLPAPITLSPAQLTLRSPPSSPFVL